MIPGNSKKALLSVAFVAALSSSACLPVLSVPSQPASASTSTQSSGSVRIGQAVKADLTGVATFTAPIEAKGAIAIVPRVNATLTKIDVDVGSKVRAGDTLAELDHTDLDQQVLAAQAAQSTAEARLAELKAGPKAT